MRRRLPRSISISPTRDAATDRTRLSSSGRSLAFSSPVSVAAIGPAQRLCHAGGMGDQDGLAAALDVFDE
jgi:hypothetical protein